MAKKIVQDVLPPERRTIRDIPIPGTKQKKKGVTVSSTKSSQVKIPKERRKPTRNYTRISIWVVASVCVIAMFYFGSFIFAGATITVTPKHQTVEVNATVLAQKETSDKNLSYTIISVSKEGTKIVPAKGEEKVDVKATGKIIIYNNYSSAPQQLVKTTRFETPDGLIFRTTENVTVPGLTKTNSILLPGYAKVSVIADKSGEKYNVGLADFTITGFKGDPKFTKFNAKTDPTSKIGGGFSGIVKKVSDADKLSAKNEIETSLKSDLIALAKQQVPSSHILFDDMVLYSFEPSAQKDIASSTATIGEKGTVYGVLFDKIELTKFLTDKNITYDENNNPAVFATNLEKLNVIFSNKNSFNPAVPGNIQASIKGSLNITWDIDAKNSDGNSLVEELAGHKRPEIKDILSKFSSIDRAEVSISPVWSLSFPKNPNKIKVKIDSPETQ